MDKKIYYQVRAEVDKLITTNLIERGGIVHKYITGNANFPNPTVEMPAFSIAIEELKIAQLDAATGDRTKIAFRNGKDIVVRVMMRMLADYVNSAAAGDKDIILSSGFDVRSTPTPPQELDAPEKVEVLSSKTTGAMVVKAKRVKGAKSYVAQYAQEGTPNWLSTFSSLSKITVEGLAPGTTYSFRMACVNSKGQSKWSQQVEAMAI